MTRKHRLLLVGLLIVCNIQTLAQCPEIGYDNASTDSCYVARGWDTALTCKHNSIILVPTYTAPVAILNGLYSVNTIPFNPPDSTFYSTEGGGSQIPISVDDSFYTAMPLPFPFNFFGINYYQAVVGANGIVSFDAQMSRHKCEYLYSHRCPIPDSRFPHKNAIYGIYEDLDPRYTADVVPNAGIYQSIHGAYPCRKLCVSYNGISPFGQQTLVNMRYSRYQIACYEGTNIIEVHIKQRNGSSTTNEGAGLIGIQNAAGSLAYVAQPRLAHDTAYNPFFSTVISNEAFRFTPLGDVNLAFEWYRGRDTIAANKIYSGTDDPGNDTLLLISERLPNSDSLPLFADCKLEVRNITTEQYITVRLHAISASNNENGEPIAYDLKYTFCIGIDRDTEIELRPAKHIVCGNDSNTLSLQTPCSNISKVTWLFADANGNTDDDERIRKVLKPLGNTGIDSTSHIMTLQPYAWSPDSSQRLDTIIVYARVLFNNGCSNYDSTLLIYINNESHITDTFTCKDSPYHFFGQDYNQTGTHTLYFDTLGCHYQETLILQVKDTLIVHAVSDCHPYTWADSTYSISTDKPCITLTNQWGCDSIINLHFTLDTSLQAIISATPPYASYDNFNIIFQDVSVNNTSRHWILPDYSEHSNIVVHYQYPSELDSITATLIVANHLSGCEDTAYLTIPFLKESIWFPNVFTPGREDNNRFLVKGTGIISFYIEIYNRQGVRVAHWSGLDGSWDGNDLHGNPCPQDTYMYAAKYTNIIEPRTIHAKNGTITLLR